MFPEFSKKLPNGFYMILASVFGINQDVIEVYNNKNIKFFCYDSIDIALKASKGVRRTKRYDLVLKIAVLHLKDYFPLVILSNSHSMIYVYQVQLSKVLGAT